MNDIIFVDVQGFKDRSNNFIVKEMSLATTEYTQTFLVKPPYAFSKLNCEERRQVTWIEKHRHILWSEGFIDYQEFHRMAKTLLLNKFILVKGNEKVNWVKKLTNECNIVDIGERGCPKLESLYEKFCKDKYFYNCAHHVDYCALKNVLCMKKWYFENHMYQFNLFW